MCTNKLSQSTLTKPFILYSVMIIIGIISGASDIAFLQSFGVMISDSFIKIFKCISMPIIALSLIVTIANYNQDDGVITSVWRKTLLYTFSTTLIAATVSCLLYWLIQPSNLTSIVSTSNTISSNTNGYWQHISSLIPSSIFTPFLEHQISGVLLVGILVGIAIRFIPDKDAKQTVNRFFKGIHGIFFVITRWVVAILPIGLFGFITVIVIQLRSGMDMTGIGEYLLIIIAANLIQGFLILPAWLRLNQINPYSMMKKMLPALSIAFFSKSSTGTLPVTMETMEKKLNVNPKISRLVLPLCTSINMNGCAAFIFTTVLFLMQNHGVEITFLTMASWILIASIAAIGNAGVPMGCFFLSASLLTSMDVPIVLLGLILPFYTIIDMIETSLNVWSDSCVVAVLDKKNIAIKNDSVDVISGKSYFSSLQEEN